jgi:hypothetical protein
MSRKLLKFLNFVGLVLVTLCLSILWGYGSPAQVPVIRNPQPEPFPSATPAPRQRTATQETAPTTPPAQCIPNPVEKASWLLPAPTNNFLWKLLESGGVRVWVPHRYQLTNNSQNQQIEPLPAGTTILSQSDDRLSAIDPTSSSRVSFTISRQGRVSSRDEVDNFINELINGLTSVSGEANEQGVRISATRQSVSSPNSFGERVDIDMDATEYARRQGLAVPQSGMRIALYFHIVQNDLWAILFSSSREDFGSRSSEFDKIVCSLTTN